MVNCYIIYGTKIFRCLILNPWVCVTVISIRAPFCIYSIGFVIHQFLLSLVWQWFIFFNLMVFIPQIRYAEVRTGFVFCLCFLSLVVYLGSLISFS